WRRSARRPARPPRPARPRRGCPAARAPRWPGTRGRPRSPCRRARAALVSDATGRSRARRSPASASRPDLPGCLAGLPEVIEQDRILVSVHAVPEPVVPVGGELPVRRKPLQRLSLEHTAVLEVVERPRLEAEEATVDPVLGA